MKKIIFILLIAHFSLVAVMGQVQQEWVQRYNGPGNYTDGAYSIAVDGLGYVYVTGYSTGSGTGNDYATIKYNSNGIQQWVKRYNGPGNDDDYAFSIAVENSGNVYVTGRSIGSGTDYDYATIKYNTNGVQEWVQRYNGPGNGSDWATFISVDGSGNVYITGYSTGNGTGWDWATIKYNTNGVQQWIQRYNGPGNDDDAAASIAVDGSGNVYVTGNSWGSGTYSDYTTIKYNTNGVQLWVQRYNGPGNDEDWATYIVADNSGNVYVTGGSFGNGTGSDYATIKYNANGVQQWVQRYNGPGNDDDRAFSCSVDGSGNVYVTGKSTGNGPYGDYVAIKYNADGVQQWVQRYNGPGNGDDEANSIAVDGSGNIYLTGSSWGSGTSYDFATLKYNTDGIQQWVQRYDGPGNGWDAAKSIIVDGSGNVYVTGGSVGIGTGYDYATIKYSQNIGVKRISTVVPDRFFLSQNYPNPFNPSTKIKFSIPLSRGVPTSSGRGVSVKLTIYDLLGHEVATLVNEQLHPGTYEVSGDGTNYPSGVYFYKLSAGGFSVTKKMVLLK
jgi:uncharacterized delta-60 repeat protein